MAIGVQLATFNYAGTAQVGDVFGFLQAAASIQVQRVQVTAQAAPVGGNVAFELVDQSGNVLSDEIVLPSSYSYRDFALPAPITMHRGNVVRARITETDLGVAQYFTLNLVGAVADFPVVPCCCGPCCV